MQRGERESIRELALALLALIATAMLAAAQQSEEGHGASLTGRASLSADLYSLDASASAASVYPQRPSSLVRLLFTPTLSYGDLSVPATLVIVSPQTNVTTLAAPNQSFTQFIQNPLNYVSISPRYGWAQLHLGSYVPRFSDLSTGDTQLFGYGIELSPKRFLLSAFSGTAQRAIEPDSAAGVRGAYKRTMYAVKIGFGDRQKQYVDFNLIRMFDDTTSLVHAPLDFTPPQEGALASLVYFSQFSDEFSMKAEGAVSLFTRDMRTNTFKNSDFNFLSGVMTIREATRIDGAGTLSLAFDEPDWGISADLRYLGDGFVPLGFPYMPSDVFEAKLSPRLHLFDSRLMLNGSLGYQFNNLSGTNQQTAKELLGMVSAVARVTDALSIAASYSNFGMRGTVENDTLKIRTTNSAITLTPSYTTHLSDATHSFSLSLSQNDYTDDNTLTGTVNRNRVRSLFGTYTLSLDSIPFSGSMALGDVTNNLPIGSVTIISATLGGSYRLLADRLLPSLNVTYSRNTIEGFTPDNQVTLRAGITYKIMPRLLLELAGTLNFYSYGSAHSNGSYSESFVQSALSTDF